MKILFLAPLMPQGESMVAPFAQSDIRILRDLGHEVLPLLWEGHLLRDLWRGLRWCDAIFAWFAGDHAAAAGLMSRKPLVVCVGGYEFARLPKYGYGQLLSRKGRIVARRVLRRADALLFVDNSLAAEASDFDPNSFVDSWHVVPTGFDSDFWTPGMAERHAILTVAVASDMERARLKGVDAFVEAAKAMPDLKFRIIGNVPYGFAAGVENVQLVPGWLDPLQLREEYRHAEVYVQFSAHEGLPSCVAEAMLCGCVPVGSTANGIPGLIGDAGVVTDSAGRLPLAIREALVMATDGIGMRASERVASTFTLERRRRSIAEILEEVMR